MRSSTAFRTSPSEFEEISDHAAINAGERSERSFAISSAIAILDYSRRHSRCCGHGFRSSASTPKTIRSLIGGACRWTRQRPAQIRPQRIYRCMGPSRCVSPPSCSHGMGVERVRTTEIEGRRASHTDRRGARRAASSCWLVDAKVWGARPSTQPSLHRGEEGRRARGAACDSARNRDMILFIDTEWADMPASELVSLALVSDCGRFEFQFASQLPDQRQRSDQPFSVSVINQFQIE
jgi:hypothetical protein